MKLTKIYTKTGDGGETSLVGGVRVKKDSVRLEAYGTVDELSSHLGLLGAFINQSATSSSEAMSDAVELLERVQNNLFNLSTYLATDTTQTPVYPSAMLDENEITLLEEAIDQYNAELPMLNSFVIPGGSVAAAQCHVCRTICRRAERRIISLAEKVEDFNPVMIKYVNRLSDYLFILSRKLNITEGIEEKVWKKLAKDKTK